MRTVVLSFADGWRWARDAFRLWRKAPALTAYLSFGYLLLLLLLSAAPLIGQFLAALAMPILQVGVLEGMRAAKRGIRPGPEILFAGFKGPWQALAVVGALNFAANLLILFLVVATVGDVTLQPMPSVVTSDDSLALTTAVNPVPLLLFLLLSLPVTAAYWFAPPLIAWYGVAWPKALFFSLYAALRNWAPLLGWSLAMGLAIFAASLVVVLVGTFLPPILFTIMLFLLPLVFVPTLFAGYFLQVDELFQP